MLKKIQHRGPDYQDFWYKDNVGLGHCLLKIQDLSNRSNQPMNFKDLILVYNGEIYNYQELRKILIKNGYTFKSSGDTEVVLKSFHFWGIDCINKFNGFFSIALYNKKTKELYLIRDRYGIKPLYYSISSDGAVVFGSEIKAVLAYPGIKPKINLNTIKLALMVKLWIPSNKTYFKNIWGIPPGNYIKVNESGIQV